MKRILVVGGTGFLGSTFLEGYSQQYRITSISRAKPENRKKGIEYLHGDWKNRAFVDSVLASNRYDCALLLTCSSHPRSSNQNPLSDFETNVSPAIYLIDRLVKTGVRRLIYASSAGALYKPQKYEINEMESNLNPSSAYASAKLSIENYLNVYGELFDSPFITLRISNPFGEQQDPDGSQGIVAIFSGRALHGKSIQIFPDGLNKKDYIYAKDVARAFECAINCKDKNLKAGNNVFNIGSGNSYSALEIANLIGKLLGKTAFVSSPEEHDLGQEESILLSISKAKQVLGWQPMYNFVDAMHRTINFYKNKKPEIQVLDVESEWEKIPKGA